MRIVGQGGVRAVYGNGTLLLTPEEQAVQIVTEAAVASANPLKDMYFYAYRGSDGESVWINPGLLIFDVLAYSGLGINVSGPLGVPFIVNSFTPSTDGFIYYEAEVDETESSGITGATSSLVHIGVTDYAFELTTDSLYSVPGPGFVEGTMIYSTSRPSSSPGYYRKTICTLSVDADGKPFRIKQEHIGAIFISNAVITKFPSFLADSP